MLYGSINKRVVNISGDVSHQKVYVEGQIIDGMNHTFTSSVTANCDMLDVYFWNRFPSFKEVAKT